MRLIGGEAELVIQLPERHAPDGLCVDVDGRLYVASTYAHCVSVVEGAEIVDRYVCGDGMATNCCFGGTELYVTESRRGTLWRYPVGVEGLQLRS
jgi:sugar lactone lactonase YvrE